MNLASTILPIVLFLSVFFVFSFVILMRDLKRIRKHLRDRVSET